MFRSTLLALTIANASAFAPAFVPTRGSAALAMGKVVVELDKVTGLQDEDTLGTSDPYVSVNERNAIELVLTSASPQVKFELEQDNFLFDKVSLPSISDIGNSPSVVFLGLRRQEILQKGRPDVPRIRRNVRVGGN